MEPKVTIKDIAKNTGTSVASVHRALHGGSGVGKDLRRRILEEAKRCHYQFDETASLMRRSTIHITVLLPRPENNERFYYHGLWQGIAREAARLQRVKASVRMVETSYGVDQIAKALEMLYDEMDQQNERMDGLVTICDDEESAVWIRRFIRRGTAVALVDRSLPIEGIACSVAVGVADMGRAAMELAALYCFREGTSSRSLQRDFPGRFVNAGQEYPIGQQPGIVLVNSSRHRSSARVFSDAARERMRQIWGECEQGLTEYSEVTEQEVRSILRNILQTASPAAVITASARSTFWVCDEISRFYDQYPHRRRERPPVIGTDLYPEQARFFEDGTLKATIYQSHLTSGEQCMSHLFDHLVGLDSAGGTVLPQPLCIIMKDNYRSFLANDLHKNKMIV